MRETEYLTSVSVYRNHLGDSTRDGVTSRHNKVILFGLNYSEEYIKNIIKEKNYDIDECLQVVRGPGDYIKAVPVNLIYQEANNKLWVMFGGNFVYTCDSRFKELTGGLRNPIPVHDRREDYVD